MFRSRPRITVENAHRVRQAAVIEHNDASCLAWSPDGKALAVGDWMYIDRSKDKDIDRLRRPTFLWLNAIDHLEVPPRRHEGHQSTLGEVAFSPDGRLFVSTAYDGTVRFWDLLTGEHLDSLSIPGYSMHSLAFSPDGKLLAASGPADDGDPYFGTGIFALWDVESLTHRVLLEYERWVGEVLFSPDGNLLAYSTVEGTVHLWDVRKNQKLASLPLKSNYVPMLVEMKFSLHELLLVPTDEYEGSLQAWNWETGEHRVIASLPYDRGTKFHPSESLIAFVTDDPSHFNRDVIHLLNWAPEDWSINKPLQVLEPGDVRVSMIAFSPDGRVLATADDDAVRLWAVE
jgi:WD40 repeat protein